MCVLLVLSSAPCAVGDIGIQPPPRLPGLLGSLAPDGDDEIADESKDDDRPANGTDIFDIPLEELMGMSVATAATLFPTESRFVPAAVTSISGQQISRSGARNLDELLDIHVPGFQYMHKFESRQMGIRGIISDRNNKMLLLVNGRVMNGKTVDLGAYPERHMSMLGDIQSVDVVRGPGSAVHGPGAIAGVIKLTTYNGLNFEGFDVQARQGFVEEFTNFEARYGKKLGEDTGIFLYYGIDNYKGSDQKDSPMIFSSGFTASNGQAVVSGQPVPFDIQNDAVSHRSQARHKVHAQFTSGSFDAWVRYTRGGEAGDRNQAQYMNPAISLSPHTTGYQQITVFMQRDFEVSDTVTINTQFSYDILDFDRVGDSQNFTEEEYYGRIMALAQPNADHSIAIGFEISHEQFGKDSLGYPGGDAMVKGNLTRAGDTSPWNTDTRSGLGEYQWRVNDLLTVILGGRVDDHTYTDALFSPRAALVITPNDADTWKFMYNRSIRRADDVDLRVEFLTSGSRDGQAEEIDSFELRFERQHSEELWFALSAYTGDYDIVAFTFTSPTTGISTDLGNLDFYGLEAEMIYATDKTRIIFSHNFTKHIDFDLASPTIIRQNVSASPYGFGNDLANWSNHVTKFTVECDICEQATAYASLRYYWGYPGGEDLADYNAAAFGGDPRLPVSDGTDRAFEESIFLNLGVEVRASESTTISVHAFNVLGWIDKDYNKRNFFQRTGQYRSQAPGVGITVHIKG